MITATYDPDTNEIAFLTDSVSGYNIPPDPANRHYQEVLDAIIAEGADCFDGDIPEELQAAADAKLASGAYNANRA